MSHEDNVLSNGTCNPVYPIIHLTPCITQHCGTRNQPQVFLLAEVPRGVMGVRLRVMDVRGDMLVFPGFRGPDRCFGHWASERMTPVAVGKCFSCSRDWRGLSGPVRDTPHIAQYPFEIVSQRGVSHAFSLFHRVSRKYR